MFLGWKLFPMKSVGFVNVDREMCSKDKDRWNLWKNLQPSNLTWDDYQALMVDTFMKACTFKTRFGGHYLKHCHSMDGQKYVCMDNILSDIDSKSCIVYSFGIAGDWSFEDSMSSIGCYVFAYDPTVDYPKWRGKNIHFEKLGVRGKVGSSNNYNTLSEIISKNGHQDTKISYLKLDIEGDELSGLPLWQQSGALRNVQQLALEVHLSDINSMTSFVETIKRIQLQDSFRLINWDPNLCAMDKKDGSFFKLVELVFKKVVPLDTCN